MTIPELYDVWKDFLKRWPVEALERMTLEEYAGGAGDKDSFCYWVERKAGWLGAVTTPPPIKWQIYKRNPDNTYDASSPKDENYVWRSAEFTTSEEAFAATKKDILETVAGVQKGDLSVLDRPTALYPLVLRKIAFLYQDMEHPKIIPIYKKAWLEAEVADGKEKPISQLYTEVIAKYPEKNIFEIAGILSEKNNPKEEAWVSGTSSVANLDFAIWKMTHSGKIFSQEAYDQCLQEHVITTGDKGQFCNDSVEWDVVYVCMAARKLSVLGLIAPEPCFTRPSPRGDQMWFARHFIPLRNAITDRPYDSDRNPETGEIIRPKGGMPGFTNSFSAVQPDSLAYFEERVLKPFFGLTIAELKELREQAKAKGYTPAASVASVVEEPAPESEAPEATEPEEPLRSLLDLTGYPGMLATAYNLILSGAPGTGKTFMARQIADEMIASSREVFKARHRFVQFHLSYDYTDFVEGLRAYEANGQIGFRREDGIFKAFCKSALSVLQKNIGKAYRNCLAQLPETIPGDYGAPLEVVEAAGMLKVDGDTIPVAAVEKFVRDGVETPEHPRLRELVAYLRKEHSHVIPPFVFIIDEINRGDLSKVFGELFFALDPGYRGPAGTIQTQYQNLVPEDDVFADGFYVPENVYIIGTMNDIDRNVESMDLAIRRRFTWSKVQPEEKLDMLSGLEGCDYLGENPVAAATARLNAVNEAIMLPDLRLSEDYKVGPAYFLKLKVLSPRDGKTAWDLLWEKHLEPLLSEYLRNRREKDELLRKLKDAYDLKFAAESQY